MRKNGSEQFRAMLSRNHELAVKTRSPEFPLAEFEELQRWQLERLTTTFDDLYRSDGYRHAVKFFVSDLYGGLDFRERDQEMNRVAPVMIRFLPDNALVALAEAFELQAISLEYDVAMAVYMARSGIRRLDMQHYSRSYLECSDRPGRERQILLIRKLGRDLQGIVKKPMVNRLVRLLRGPAHAAGFGNLQEFLELGLTAFRELEDPVVFVDIIYEREWASMERLFAGDADPFSFRKTGSRNDR